MIEVFYCEDCQQLSTQKIQPFSFRNEGSKVVLNFGGKLPKEGKIRNFFSRIFLFVQNLVHKKIFSKIDRWEVGKHEIWL